MERKTISQAQIYVRDAVNRASQQAAARDFAGAVKTLLPVLKRNLDIPLLFERIREYEISKAAAQGGGSRFLAILVSIFKMPIVRIIAAIDPVKAMKMCEDTLAWHVNNPLALGAMLAASDKADAPWGMVSALKVICKFSPGNQMRMRQLAEAMQQNNQALDALKIHQELLKKSSGGADSMAKQTELREAMALASIERGNFNDRTNHRANTADAEDAMISQLLQGTIHDAEQANVLIRRFTAELRKGDSLDMRRKLADAYMVAEMYEEAYNEYKNVADKLGVMDPVLDKHIEKAYLSQLKQNIDVLRAEPDAYEDAAGQIAEIEKEYADYHWRHTVRRAEKFSGDMQLQFDLGVLYFEHNYFKEAEDVFTRVADNPQKRRASLVYIGRCACAVNEFDRAVTVIEEALKDMGRMDIQKRDALYHLAIAKNGAGDKAGSLEIFRKISENMSNYRDIQERIAALEATPVDGNN